MTARGPSALSRKRARARAVSECRSMRTGSVAMPRSTRKAEKGATMPPVSTSTAATSRTRRSGPLTAPAMTSEWPLSHFVADSTTRSAPSSIGRQRYGEANVLSTTTGAPGLGARGGHGGGGRVVEAGVRVAAPGGDDRSELRGVVRSERGALVDRHGRGVLFDLRGARGGEDGASREAAGGAGGGAGGRGRAPPERLGGGVRRPGAGPRRSTPPAGGRG